MFLFIFESIGTSELILIGSVALIVFGPRKLPQMAKTLGKAMAEFKNTTNEFKSTWEREANFEETNAAADKNIDFQSERQSITQNGEAEKSKNYSMPEIKEIDASQFDIKTESKKPAEDKTLTEAQAEKQNWL